MVLPLDVAIETSQLMLDTLKMADDWQTNLDNDYFYHLSENYTVNFWREWGVVDDSAPYFITIFHVDSDGITDYGNRAWSNYVEPLDDDEDECSIFVYKPCPFCGAEPSLQMYDDKPYVFCTNAACPILGCAPIALHLWNARPVEEGLIDRLHEAVSDNKQQAKEQTSERERRGTMKVSIAVERLQYGYVTVDVDSLDEAKEIQDFNGYDVTSQTTEDWHVPDTLLNKDGWYEVEEGEEAKLKPCPFCGGAKICTEKSINLNYCDSCSAESNVEHWNTRPIEDELRARIAELEAEKCVLIDQQREAENHLIDKNLHIDSLYEEGYKLQQRIAELEAMVERLIEAGDSLSYSLCACPEEYKTIEVCNWNAIVAEYEECEE